MYPYRKTLELYADKVLLRSIALMTQHSRQRVTEIIELAKQKRVNDPLEEEMTDSWLEDFLYPEKKQEASGRYLMDFEYIHKVLARPNVTLTLLHDEYVQETHEAVKSPMLIEHLQSIIVIMQ